AEIVLGEISRESPDAWDIDELRGRVEMAREHFFPARDAFRRAAASMPDISGAQFFGPAIYMESLCDDGNAALAMLARSATACSGKRNAADGPHVSQPSSEALLLLEREVRRLAAPWLAPGRRVAAFLLDPGLTLGHVVIEPFYIANLAAHAYDHV